MWEWSVTRGLVSAKLIKLQASFSLSLLTLRNSFLVPLHGQIVRRSQNNILLNGIYFSISYFKIWYIYNSI